MLTSSLKRHGRSGLVDATPNMCTLPERWFERMHMKHESILVKSTNNVLSEQLRKKIHVYIRFVLSVLK